MKTFITSLLVVILSFAMISGDNNKIKLSCNLDVIANTENKLNNNLINENQICQFLLTFDSLCSGNTEYTEYSNEVLFKLLEMKPDILINVLIKKKIELDTITIYKNIKNPVSELSDLKKILKRIKELKLKNAVYTRIVGIIDSSVNMAGGLRDK